LTKLTRKDVEFEWLEGQQRAFEAMVQGFTMAPNLQHFDYGREVVIETDASDYVSAGVLSQWDDEGVLHPVAYYSKKHTPAECNYDIYAKELMAIIKALEKWRPECEGVELPLQFYMDHKNLEYFGSKMLLNRRQPRWSEFLSTFECEIVYRPGKSNGNVDALTRRPADLPEGGDERLKSMEQVVLKPENLSKQLPIFATAMGEQTIQQQLEEALEKDELAMNIMKALRKRESVREITIEECSEEDGQLCYRGKIYIPENIQLQRQLIKEHHETPLAGHPGRSKTFDLLS
jgi:hypothetical protein